MPFQVSPGVAWYERDLTNIVPGIATSTGAYVGAFRWGPVMQVKTLDGEGALKSQFGKPDADTAVHFFTVASGFFSYGDNLKLVRVAGEAARNAASGGRGAGLTLDTTALNGEIVSVVIKAGGTAYVVGDLVRVTGSVEDAEFRVTKVDNIGLVTGLVLLYSGRGHQSGTGVATSVVSNVRVDNDEDVLDDIYLPEIIAKYPGEMGNSLLFSSARASEFDRWSYKNRFAIAPDADVIKWNGTGAQVSFPVNGAFTTLPADAVVTVDGFARSQGVDAGTFKFENGLIVFNEDSENFEGAAKTNVFTLTNEFGIDTSAARVTLADNPVPVYTGAGNVPAGYVRIRTNTVEFGLGRATFSGDDSTKVFKILNAANLDDAAVTVDGVDLEVISTGVPTASQALVQTTGADTTVTFAAGSEPNIGLGNVVVRWGFPDVGADIIVKYGAPAKGVDNVKLFRNQTEIHAVVVDKLGKFGDESDALLERYDFLSLVPGTKNFDGTTAFYKDSINRRSQYVYIPEALFNFESKLLSGGVDANDRENVDPGKYQAGYNLFSNPEEDTGDVSHVIAPPSDPASVIYLIGSFAEVRRDVVVYHSPPMDACVQNRTRETDDIIKYRDQLPSTSYAHMDSNWKYVYDRYNDKYVWVPCAGDVAGIYALTHETYDPWWSGGGLNRGRIRNATKLAWTPKQTDRDRLYANGINPITTFRGEGPVLWGDKTMQTKASAFQAMNVRWLFITLEKSISSAARYYVFEFNDTFTRNQFKNMVHPYLRDVMGRRGIEDFKIVCDESNNPGSVRMRREFNADILIKPNYAINFINLTFTAVGADVNFDEITAVAA